MGNIPTAEDFALDTMQGTDLEEISTALNNFVLLHLKVIEEEVKEKAKIERCNNGKGCGTMYCDIQCRTIDKQSISDIFDNYIKNLK